MLKLGIKQLCVVAAAFLLPHPNSRNDRDNR